MTVPTSVESIRDAFMSTSDPNADGNDPIPDGNFIISQEEMLHRNEMPSSNDLSTALCDSCLKISKNSKEFLSASSLSNEVGNLGNIFCHLMPADSEKKCEMIAEMYEHKGTTFLQEFFHDENFCTNKGFCPVNSQGGAMPPPGQTQIRHIGEHLNSVLSKLENGLPVDLTTVFNSTASLPNLKPTTELKLISAILKACETEVFVSQCKKMVFAYGPIIVTNLQKVVSLDLCHMVHICQDPRNQTSHMNIVGAKNTRGNLRVPVQATI
ncbi:unnamed protein product [Spirodela intermedia]|uniref:Saposin B-type domain-containing protein n=2 Tax=Spirodela intermedia TaxID=51605 RepID=A0A7I8L865_SPIIN|nr:unnamed protein product [Spirodela intermedia]CAA6668592.1 unnamed protein product [Spirodela intermedia]CAA7405464.1 unnamed protein product [Spirodela intermedia]